MPHGYAYQKIKIPVPESFHGGYTPPGPNCVVESLSRRKVPNKKISFLKGTADVAVFCEDSNLVMKGLSLQSFVYANHKRTKDFEITGYSLLVI